MALMRALLILCLVAAASAFVQGPVALKTPARALSRATQVSRVQRASGRAGATALSMSSTPSYWEGEWICADCGYIYDAEDCGGLYFEQQPRGWVCPQCRGPRRRFAKKVGDQVGITQDGGDAPILVFSFVGFALTIAFGYWFAGQ